MPWGTAEPVTPVLTGFGAWRCTEGLLLGWAEGATTVATTVRVAREVMDGDAEIGGGVAGALPLSQPAIVTVRGTMRTNGTSMDLRIENFNRVGFLSWYIVLGRLQELADFRVPA